MLCNEMELATSLALRLTQSFLLSFKWEDAFRVLAKCPSAKVGKSSSFETMSFYNEEIDLLVFRVNNRKLMIQ